MIPQSELDLELTDKTQIVYVLPYSKQSLYGTLFRHLEGNLSEFGLVNMGVISGTLDEVFFKLGGETSEVYDSSDLSIDMSQYMRPSVSATSNNNSISNSTTGDRSSTDSGYNDSGNEMSSTQQWFIRLLSQVEAIALRKIVHARKDKYTGFLIMPVILLSLLAALLYQALLIPPDFQNPTTNSTTTTTSSISSASFVLSSQYQSSSIASAVNVMSNYIPLSSCVVTPYQWIASHQASYSTTTMNTNTHPSISHHLQSTVTAHLPWHTTGVESSPTPDGSGGNITITDDAVLQLLQHAPPTLIADALTVFLFYMMFLSELK